MVGTDTVVCWLQGPPKPKGLCITTNTCPFFFWLTDVLYQSGADGLQSSCLTVAAVSHREQAGLHVCMVYSYSHDADRIAFSRFWRQTVHAHYGNVCRHTKPIVCITW